MAPVTGGGEEFLPLFSDDSVRLLEYGKGRRITSGEQRLDRLTLGDELGDIAGDVAPTRQVERIVTCPTTISEVNRPLRDLISCALSAPPMRLLNVTLRVFWPLLPGHSPA
jgi:hypothetical protein